MPEKSAVPEESVTVDEGVAPIEEEAATESTVPEEEAASEEPVVEELTLEESAEVSEPPVVENGEAGEAFQDMMLEAEAADGAYKNALAEENRLNNEVAETRNDLMNAEDSLEAAQGGLEDRASEIYKHGQDGFLGVLLEAEDFSQFANLLGFWVQLLEKDQDEVQKWRDSKSELEQTTEELETQLQSWEGIREDSSAKKEEAQARVDEAEEFFEALDEEAQEEIEEQRASEAQLALDHAEKLIQNAAQDQPVEKAGEPGETTGDEQVLRAAEPENQAGGVESELAVPVPEEEAAPDRTPEEEQTRQVEVAQAVAETIREWPVIKQQAREAAGESAEEPAGEPAEATQAPDQNPAAEQLAAAAEKQAEAQEQSRQAAEQTARERQAADEANVLADEAEKARLAVERAPAAEQEAARAAAEEAKRQAGLASEQALKEKQVAEDLALRATDRLSAAEEDFNAAQMAAGNPLAPGAKKPAIAPSGAGGGVLGEAKSWLGVPYDYSHSAGMTRRAVDCSAFTAAVYSKFGLTLPDSPAGQLGMGTPVSGPARAGDLVFFSEDGSGMPTHVGIANGDGTITHSSSFTGEVSVTPMSYINGYMGARRLI